MVAITGTELTRRAELAALWTTATAALLCTVVPSLYAVVVPTVCGIVAVAAPVGRRTPAAIVSWGAVSVAAMLGGLV